MYDFLLIASVLVFLAICLAYARHRAASFAHPASFYLAFHGFVFVIRPIFARIYDFQLVYYAYDFQPSMADKITVILGANVAMLVFVGVALLVGREPMTPAEPGSAARTRQAMAKPILIVMAALTPLALWSQLENWRLRVTGYESMARDVATGVQINVEGNGWFTDSALLMVPMAVMFVWLARYRWWSWSYFAIFALLQSGSGTRGPLIVALAAVAVIYLFEKRRRWFDWRAVALALVGAVAFNQIVLDRGSVVRELAGGTPVEDRYAPPDLAPLEHMDFANLEFFEYIVYAVPQRTGSWDYFANNLQVLTEPIPRALWKDKPIGSPVQFFSLWDYGEPIGMTASVPGLGWMSFGYLGIIIQAGALALLYAMLYRALLVRRATVLARLFYALVIAMAVLVFRDGGLLTPIRLVPFYLGPLLLAAGMTWLYGTSGDRSRTAPGDAAAQFLRQSPAERRRNLAASLEIAKTR